MLKYRSDYEFIWKFCCLKCVDFCIIGRQKQTSWADWEKSSKYYRSKDKVKMELVTQKE